MEQPTTVNRNEIITLILADMRSRKLIMGLEAAGLPTDDFNTHLAELIFAKMQIPKQDLVQIGNWYEVSIYQLLDTDLNKFRVHQEVLAMRLYEAMEKKKQCMHNAHVLRHAKKPFPFLKWVWGWRGDH